MNSVIVRGMQLLLVWLLVVPAQAVQVSDDHGAVVRLARAPQRVVSLLPSLTETMCALDQCQRLVAVDRYSNYPASVQALPKVGGGLDPNIEAIVALKPDLVLIASSAGAGERLRALGIPVLALEPKTYADLERVIQTLGTVLGLPDAQALWRSLQAEMQAVAQAVPATARGRRVYFEVNRAPYAASESSFIGETLGRLGVKNIVPAKLGPFPKLNPEFVVRADPDLIMVGDSGYTDVVQRPGWAMLRAVRQGRVCVFTQQQSDILVRPGPRMAEGARLMLQCLKDKAP